MAGLDGLGREEPNRAGSGRNGFGREEQNKAGSGRNGLEREEFDALKETVAAQTETLAKIAEKLDGIVSADQGRMRLSREQETASSHMIHEPYEMDDDMIMSHPLLAARDGMAQMWIRLSVQGHVDSGNILRMCAPNRGWRPRAPDTLPPELASVMAKTFEGEPIIQYRDSALYERPKEMNDRQIKKIQKMADMQLRGIEQDLRRGHVAGQVGFGAPVFTERKRSVVTGRPAQPE